MVRSFAGDIIALDQLVCVHDDGTLLYVLHAYADFRVFYKSFFRKKNPCGLILSLWTEQVFSTMQENVIASLPKNYSASVRKKSQSLPILTS